MTWQERAACAGMPSLVFFPGASAGRKSGAKARAVCATCPVTTECLAYTDQWERGDRRYGIWGGLSSDQRAARSRANRTHNTEETA